MTIGTFPSDGVSSVSTTVTVADRFDAGSSTTAGGGQLPPDNAKKARKRPPPLKTKDKGLLKR
jgi:hypothetical protein